MTQQEAINKMIVCGFAAVNNGNHCWINDKCVVCNTIETIDNVK